MSGSVWHLYLALLSGASVPIARRTSTTCDWVRLLDQLLFVAKTLGQRGKGGASWLVS